MKRVWTALGKFLHPTKWVLLGLPPVVFAILAYVLRTEISGIPAYLIYGMSAYCLIIWVLPLPQLFRKAKAFILCKLNETRLGRLFANDLAFRGSVSLFSGMVVNFLYVVFRIFVGIRYASVWFISIAIYYQKTYRGTTVPFKQSKNRGEEDMYYATGTHAPIVEKDLFEKVQVLLKKRKEQFTKATTQNIYPLTSRIRCSECGSFYRRKVRSGGIKWVCARHEEDFKACNSNYYSEERIYDGFLSMVNKLRFGQENILGQVIAKLEYATQQYKRNNKTAMQISQKIAEINATILKLNELRSKGYLAPEIYQSQIRQMQKQLNELKDERQDQFESRILAMLQEVRKLKALIDEIEEPLDEFDEKLFEEIVMEMSLNHADELTITLLGGLKFTELI